MVDDEDIIRLLVKDAFELYDHKVNSFEFPHEALEFYKKEHKNIDLLILDYYMPNMNGIELYIELKKINLDILYKHNIDTVGKATATMWVGNDYLGLGKNPNTPPPDSWASEVSNDVVISHITIQ